MKFQKLIDKESILLDGKRLAECRQSNMAKTELFERIDNIKYDFIDSNDLAKEWGVMTLICKLIQEVKEIL